MTKIDVIQALCDYFDINLEDFGWSVTQENYKEILNTYDFVSGASLWYGWQRLSLGEVVKALSCLCDESDWSY